jgi:hypothetical protein
VTRWSARTVAGAGRPATTTTGAGAHSAK